MHFFKKLADAGGSLGGRVHLEDGDVVSVFPFELEEPALGLDGGASSRSRGGGGGGVDRFSTAG
jgi:hypothetical protein